MYISKNSLALTKSPESNNIDNKSIGAISAMKKRNTNSIIFCLDLSLGKTRFVEIKKLHIPTAGCIIVELDKKISFRIKVKTVMKIIPDRLKKGDKIGIISTARKIRKEELESAIMVFKNWGLDVVFGKYLFSEYLNWLYILGYRLF